MGENDSEGAASAGDLEGDALRHHFENPVAGNSITELTGELRANRVFCEMLGYTLAEAKGFTWTELTHPDDVALTRAGFDSLLNGQETSVRVEKRFLHKNGSPVWVTQGTTLRRDGQARPLHFISTTIDITERKRAETGRLAAEAELRASRALLDGLDSGVVVHAPDGRVTFANQRAGELLGIPPQELQGRLATDPAWVFVDEGQRELAPEEHPVARVLATRSPVTGVVLGINSSTSDSRVWVLVNSFPELDGHGQPCRVVMTFVDITERKRLEQELRHSQKMEGVGRLVGGIAHDFNNLLTVILGFAGAIKDSVQHVEPIPQGPITDSVGEIERAAHSAVALTRQLLTYSRRRMPRPERVDLNAVVGNFQKVLKRVLGENVAVCLNLAPNLAPVTLDLSGMEQILMNLAVNSRDAMPRGGTFTLETENLDQRPGWSPWEVKPGPCVVIRVTDTGEGMPLDVQERLFEPFFTTKESGTGLGLSTVFGIVKQAGGHVAVSSEAGRGTTFTFWLPQATGEESPAVASKRDSGVRKGSTTVLVVDDAEPIRRALRRTLERGGYMVLDAACGVDALRLCQSYVSDIDVLVSDVVMPGMNGPELLAQFQQLRPDSGALFITGFPDELISSYGVLKSGTELLQKPFTPEALMQKVKAALRGRAPGEPSVPAGVDG